MFVAQHVCPLLLWCALLAGELASAFGGVRRGFSTKAAEDFSEVQVRLFTKAHHTWGVGWEGLWSNLFKWEACDSNKISNWGEAITVSTLKHTQAYPLQKTAYRRANGGSGSPGVHEDVLPKFVTSTALNIQERLDQEIQEAWPKLVVRKTFLDLED